MYMYTSHTLEIPEQRRWCTAKREGPSDLLYISDKWLTSLGDAPIQRLNHKGKLSIAVLHTVRLLMHGPSKVQSKSC
jgi:hypothetical protein